MILEPLPGLDPRCFPHTGRLDHGVPSRKKTPFTLKTASDRAVLADFGGGISEETEREVASLARRLREARMDGVLAVQPAYTSVLVKFDPARLARDELERALQGLAGAAAAPA